ncbi:transposase [Octopus vulgaris]|uniref:Transposase n=1 Tax=Octopus vulgaris TaxID=6645 RepID=A0AA36AL74_OCTVU|nr:transposase [Octopus vulgaris]
MAPKGKDLSEDLKKIIFNLHKNGLGYKLISKRIHISVNTVAKVIQKHKDAGRISNRHRSDRPSNVMEDRSRTGSPLAQEVSSLNGKSESVQTVRRSLNQCGLHGCIPRRKPLLTTRHKPSHLSFAETYVRKEFWNTILCSDETKINLFRSNGIKRV